jgi:hypothetical protein
MWMRVSLPLGPVPGLVLLAGRPLVLLFPGWVQVNPTVPLAHISSLSHDQRSVVEPGCSSRIPDPNFSIPDPGSKRFRIKKLFLSSRNYDPGCSSRIRTLIFYPSRIPGSKRHLIPDPGSATLDQRLRFFFVILGQPAFAGYGH